MKFWQALAFADPEHLLALAESSEECGFEGVTVSDHLFYPQEMRSHYPYSDDGTPPFNDQTPWPDPWVLLAAMAAATSTLRLTTNIYVAPARDVFTVAKAVSTAAVLSGGRVALGTSAGWCREEFDATGQDFATRGKRLNEMIPALRALWTGEWTEFHGTHVDFAPVRMSPVPAEPIPILIGGESPAALRRAATLGDGWIANGLTPEAAEQRLIELRTEREIAGRSKGPFEILIPLMARPDADLYKRMEDLGVTGVIVAPWMAAKHDGDNMLLERRIAAVERFAAKVISGP